MPKPKVISLKSALPDEEVDPLAGKLLDESHYDRVVDYDCNVYTPEGEPLLIFRRKVLPAAVCRAAYPALRKAAVISQNRGYAAGDVPERVEDRKGNRVRAAAVMTGTRARPLKKDGTVSNTNYAQEVESGIIGYFDRNARFPYCRMTAFNMNQPEKFAAALPFIRAVDAVFKKELPERYEAQMEFVRHTSPDFHIHGTSFTTLTINRNWRTAVHKDAGDLKQGFGVMSAFRAGRYKGCYLIFPKYRVAADMSTCDVLLADVHQWHGNSPLIGVKGAFERISCVFYYREGIKNCGTAAEERDRAKNRKAGEPVVHVPVGFAAKQRQKGEE